MVAAGVQVLDQAFFARGNLATAGGCLASHYLAAWIIARLESREAAESALHYIARAWRNINPYLPAAEPSLVFDVLS